MLGYYLIVISYLLIAIGIIIFLDLHNRNYWRRGMIPLHPCPFSNQRLHYHQISDEGKRDKIEGIVSYSLYGNYNKYYPPLEQSLIRIKIKLPNWQGRVYVAVDIPSEIKSSLLDHGAEVITIGPDPPIGHEAAVWRFLPLAESLPFVCLDADDIFNDQRVNQINQWIESKQPFCNLAPVIFTLPFTANAWGARDCPIPDIQERINRYCEHCYGFDEAFLKYEIWSVAQDKGCWFTSPCLRLDKGMSGYLIVTIAIIVIGLILVYRDYKQK